VNKQETGLAVRESPTLALWNAEEQKLIKETVAKGATDPEFRLFLYTAARYGLDPLVRQIWCVKYSGHPAQIFAGRDGFLSIAHRSGEFAGIRSGTRKDEDGEIIGWAEVHRKDFEMPFRVEVYLSEYHTGQSLWKSKPRTMIKKVAEAQALRQAFDITGIYIQEEIDPDKSARSESVRVEAVPVVSARLTDNPYETAGDSEEPEIDENAEEADVDESEAESAEALPATTEELEALRKRIWPMWRKHKRTSEQLRDYLQEEFSKTSLKDLTAEECEKAIAAATPPEQETLNLL